VHEIQNLGRRFIFSHIFILFLSSFLFRRSGVGVEERRTEKKKVQVLSTQQGIGKVKEQLLILN